MSRDGDDPDHIPLEPEPESPPNQFDLRRPTIGFFLTVGGALFAGAIAGGPLIEILPVALLLGMLFALGMWAAQRFGPQG
jgi:hypothetical protein